MTYHSHSPWDFNKDEITDELIDEIVEGVLWNGSSPLAYAIFSHTDTLILNVGNVYYNNMDIPEDIDLKLKEIYERSIKKLNHGK